MRVEIAGYEKPVCQPRSIETARDTRDVYRVKLLSRSTDDGSDQVLEFLSRDDAMAFAEQAWAAGGLYGVVIAQEMTVEETRVWAAIWSFPIVSFDS
ncbi:hypothetical protein sos41_07110 [Alphaproteobacteria bacterium SO-S41]|nr:hypothetical protein sos41_07110 [Alphaproteobacteria bacterium SO-S41]